MKICIIVLVIIDIVFNYDASLPLLQDDFKTDVEYSFDVSNEDSIRKFFYNYRENEINLNTGSSFKCYVPSKIKSDYDNPKINTEDKYDNVPENIITQIMRLPSTMCYNTNLKEWFYKVCPFKSSQQILIYKKKNEQGEEYTEKFMLGFSLNLTRVVFYLKQFSPFENFLKDNTTVLNKLVLKNLTDEPIVMTEGNIAKIYNYNLGLLKDFDCSLIINYNTSEFDIIKDKDLFVTKNQTLEEYLKEVPNATEVPFERNIIRLIGNHILLLSSKFPYPRIQNKLFLNPIKMKKSNEIQFTSNLQIYKEYVYCFGCEFLTHYNIGDSLILKNSKYFENHKENFKGKSHQGRIITEILNNNFLKLNKPFGKFYQLSSLRSSYSVIDSFNKTYRWKGGSGYIKSYKNLIFGFKTNFNIEVKEGDRIFMLDTLRNAAYFRHSTTNPKFNHLTFCVVKKILNRNMLIAEKSCVVPNNFQGNYFISKLFDENDIPVEESGIINYNGIEDLNSVENKSKIKKAKSDMYRPKLNLNLLDNKKKENKMFFKTIDRYSNLNKTLFGLIDFHMFEEISFNRMSKVFYSHQYISHKGLILKRPNDCVLKLKIEKLASGFGFLRMVFSTNLDNFSYNSIDEDTDYELILHSDHGIALKKISKLDVASINTFQFLDTDIRSFFTESTNIDIIFLNKSIYFSSGDDDYESSIKIHLELSEPVKFISFDAYKSHNLAIKSIKLINFIESTLVYNIYVFQNRMKLSENTTYVERQINGDFCDDINSNRTSIIEYRCDKTGNHDLIIDKVDEIGTCEYKYSVRSRYLCNPYELMKNKIMNSIAKVKCIVKNNIYNKNSQDLFNKLV